MGLKHRDRRKLEIVLRDLVPLANRGKITRFLNSADDVNRLGGLTEDIRDAMMDYQVRPQSRALACVPPNAYVRRRYNKISMTRTVGSL